MGSISSDDQHRVHEARRLIAMAGSALSEAKTNIDDIEDQALRQVLREELKTLLAELVSK